MSVSRADHPTTAAGDRVQARDPWSATRAVLLVALVVGLAASISVSQIALGALAGWLLLARRAGRMPPLHAPLLVPVAAFAAWTIVAALASARPLESLVASKHLLNLAALIVIANALSDRVLVRRFATWLVLALTVVAVIAIVQVAACPGPEATAATGGLLDRLFRKCTRARGLFSIYMTLAGVLAMVLALALPRVARLRADLWWLGPAWLVLGAALALTYVRGAWLGFMAGALTAIGIQRRRGLVGIGVLALFTGLVLLALPGVTERVKTIGRPTDDTTRDRLAMMEAGLRLVRAHPVTGVGPGQVKHLYPGVATPQAMRRSTSHLHNTPLQIAVERGLVGLAAWLWIVAAFVVRAAIVLRRLPTTAAADRALVIGALAAVVTFLVAGLFEYSFGDTEVLLVALAIMALPFALDHAPTTPPLS